MKVSLRLSCRGVNGRNFLPLVSYECRSKFDKGHIVATIRKNAVFISADKIELVCASKLLLETKKTLLWRIIKILIK